MFSIISTNGSITIKHGKTQAYVTVRRNNETKDVEVYHNLEGKDVKPGMAIKKIMKAIMGATGSKTAYSQRFTKVATELRKVGNATTFAVFANRLETMQEELAA